MEVPWNWKCVVSNGCQRTNSGHLQQVLNTEVSCGPSTSELKKVRINTLEDVLSSDLRSFISSDVVEDMILFTKQLFEQIRKYFINDNQYRFHTNIHRIQLLWFLQKQGLWNVKYKIIVFVRCLWSHACSECLC